MALDQRGKGADSECTSLAPFITRQATVQQEGEIQLISFEITTVINRPITEVFGFVANFENHPTWHMVFQNVTLITSTPTGVGTAYQCKLNIPGQSAKFEITDYEANKRLAFHGNVALFVKFKGSFLFDSVAGGTKVTLRPRPEFRGPLRLLEPLMAGFIRKQDEQVLLNLKRVLES